MSGTSRSISEAVRLAGVTIEKAGRSQLYYWNRYRSSPDESRAFAGWYWYKRGHNSMHGPFNTHSAAVTDAFKQLSLQPQRMTRTANGHRYTIQRRR